MKSLIFPFLALVWMGCERQVTQSPDYPISSVDVKDVEIHDRFWLPIIKTVQDSTIPYALMKCEQEGRMENFLIAGGQKPGKKHGKMPFDDTDLYKIIEGASYSLISAPNPHLEAYVDSVIQIIKVGQEPDGYLSTWFSIDPSNPGIEWFKPSKERWDHEDMNHELYNCGHLFEAAAAHYWATGKRHFLDIALKNADLLVANFGPGKLQIPPGHQIVETGLVKLYRITNNPDYLNLAKNYLDWRGDTATHQLYGLYAQDHLPVTRQTQAVGHAVRAVYMYAGMTDVAAIFKDSTYCMAIDTLWNNVVNYKTYITGGIGARHEGEMFGENYELPNLTAYSETCAAIGSVHWNQRMFQLTGNVQYIDVLERTLYNGLIAGLSIDGKKFFYPNPLESDGTYTFNHGACTRSPWFDCSCCPTNLIRFIPSLPSLIYAQQDDRLFVNLFMANKAKVTIRKQNVEIIQKTDYPNSGPVVLEVNPQKSTEFTMLVRIPGWAQNIVLPGQLYQYIDEVTPKVELFVNGKSEAIVLENGYATLSRKWERGDVVEINLPFEVRKVASAPVIVDNQNKVAIEYGPIVFCAEEVDNPGLKERFLTPDEGFSISQMSIHSVESPVLKGNRSGLTLIPYHLWSNRGVGRMKVWLPVHGD
ncbi:hypothetical protein LX69_03062 [Breznakibacter xylanolyticus]|uniref:DUF1680 family protein n=1 Tax=Breznakibacter xylanolyticus TaxID=990 RepID=A0A2W7MUM6_9BACT|nr:glycoside hydrolase family 127 protein [Breznakibacter xylanolyticus]PZX11738.1 hypothetical protein LX69_03062 [Breznakibacter xylanolyticus]